VRFDREQRAQWKAKLQLQRRPGRLTIAAATVGRVLCDMLGNDGRLDPSHATIAARAAVHPSTVRRALEQLAEYGFLSWTRRLIRHGWRCEQTTSAYTLALPQSASLFNASFLNKPKSTLSRKTNVAGEAHADAVLAGLDIAEAKGALLQRRLTTEAQLLANRAARIARLGLRSGGFAPHRVHRRAGRDFDNAKPPEPELLVKWQIGLVGAVEIRRLLLSITSGQHVLHQHRTMSLAPVARVDADQGFSARS
jgi:hypothetical protein